MIYFWPRWLVVQVAFCGVSLEGKAGLLFETEIRVFKISEILIDSNVPCLVELKLLEGSLFLNVSVYFLKFLTSRVFNKSGKVVVAFMPGCTRCGKWAMFCSFSLTAPLVYSEKGVAVSSRFRNVGLCLKNLNSGPGHAVGSGDAALPTELVGWDRRRAEGRPEGCSIVWMMNASVMGDCLFFKQA